MSAPCAAQATPLRSGAAAHPVDQLVAGNAVLIAELLDLLLIDRIRENPQRLISLLGITETTQGVNH